MQNAHKTFQLCITKRLVFLNSIYVICYPRLLTFKKDYFENSLLRTVVDLYLNHNQFVALALQLGFDHYTLSVKSIFLENFSQNCDSDFRSSMRIMFCGLCSAYRIFICCLLT